MTTVAILAGGLATRIRPLTENFPKALINVNGRPFIDYQLRMLRDEGLKDIVLCVGYEGYRIEEYLGNGKELGISIRYSYDGNELLGTGGAIKNALPMLSDPFVVTYGDAYLPTDYQKLLSYYSEQTHQEPYSIQGLMVIYNNCGSFDKSNVVYSNGKILIYNKTVHSPSMNHIDWGVGILRKQSVVSSQYYKKFDLADLYSSMSTEGNLIGFEVHNRFYEIGSFEGLEAFKDLNLP